MMRFITLLLGLSLGLGLVLVVEGRMYHLRHFMASAEPEGTQGLSDAASLSEVFCTLAGAGDSASLPAFSNIASVLAALGDDCQL